MTIPSGMALVTFIAITQHCLSHSHHWTCFTQGTSIHVLPTESQTTYIFWRSVWSSGSMLSVPLSPHNCRFHCWKGWAKKLLPTSPTIDRLTFGNTFDTNTCWTPSLVKVFVSDQICQRRLVLKYSTRNRIMRRGMFSTLSLERSPLSLSLQLRRIMHVFSESSAEREGIFSRTSGSCRHNEPPIGGRRGKG